MGNGWKKYTQNQLSTSSPGRITVMVYEKCILNIRTAQLKIKENDYKTVNDRLINTEQLLNELLLQLDYNVFPELASDLSQLYSWAINEVRLMNIKKKEEMGEAIIEVIQNLLDGYREAMKKNGE